MKPIYFVSLLQWNTKMLQISRKVFSQLLLQPSILQQPLSPVVNFPMNIRHRYSCHSTFCYRKIGLLQKCVFRHHQMQEKTSSSFAYKRGRLNISRTDEIEEIINDNPDVISEYAMFLGCSEASVKEMVRHDTRFLTTFSKQDVLAKMKLLLDHGLNGEEITRRSYVLPRSWDCIHSRLAEIKSVEHYRPCINLLVATDRVFKKRMKEYQKEVAVMGEHESQTSFVASLLGCSEEEILAKAKRHCGHLTTMPPSRLKELVEILQSFGVSKQKMYDECFMLKCLPTVAKERLKCVIDAGVYSPDKVTHILTAHPEQLRSSLNKWIRNTKALEGLQHEKDLLMQRLQCSEKDVQNMMQRKKVLIQLRAAKLKTSLDVLMNEIGISAKSIVQFPELLFFSKKRLQSRWDVLEGQNLKEYELVEALILPVYKFHRKFL